jgi:hypothetical protein
MPALHDAAQIQRFLGDGETRLIAAGYRDPKRAGDLFLLEDGRANELRAWAKQSLRCFFKDCPKPELTTVSRRQRRDGFSHLSGAGHHSPESLNHRQGKAVVAKWLRSRLGDDAVTVEAASDTQRSRVADVMARLPSGQRVAFEVQYASLSVEQWESRHSSYREQGIIDVWLWGHRRLRRSRSSYGSNPYRLDDVQESARISGLPVLWFNPETEELAIATTLSGLLSEPMLANAREVAPVVVPLDGFDVAEPAGIVGSALDALRNATAVHQSRLDQAAQAEAEGAAERDRRARARWEMMRSIEPPRERRPALPASARAHVSEALCRACGRPLDPALIGSGYHVGSCRRRATRADRRSSEPGES